MQSINLPLRLKEVSELYPNHEAIIYNDQRISYKEFNELVNRLANSLMSIGVKEGDAVLISLTNCTEFVISYYAILRMKAVVVPVNPVYSAGELNFIMNDCQPKVVITLINKTNFITIKFVVKNIK